MPCCVAVAVSVRIAFGWRANEGNAPVRRGPARAERREEAGRASREAERRNTIVNVNICEKLAFLEVLRKLFMYRDDERYVYLTQPGSVGTRALCPGVAYLLH